MTDHGDHDHDHHHHDGPHDYVAAIQGYRAAARLRGLVGGRPPALVGPRLDHARELAAAGMSATEIADVLLVGRSTVYRALRTQPRKAMAS
jgi:DNA invertase Pin-like site-specific DNA recombinase